MGKLRVTERSPLVSVIVPTHNRCAELAEGLAALSRQDLPASDFEVVVAMDACTDGTAEMLAKGDWPFALRSVVPQGRGAACARNAGAAQARGERLLFLDDDITADPGLLRAHLEAARTDPEVIVIGYSEPVIPTGGWFAKGLAAWWNELFDTMERPDHLFAFTDVLTGNLSVGKAVFDRLGGFDSGLACREDHEFGYRAIRAGVPLTFSRAARGLHRDASTLARSFARAEAEGAADVVMARLHPALRMSFPMPDLPNASARSRLRRRILGWSLPHRAGIRRAGLRLMDRLESLGLYGPWARCHGLMRAWSYRCGALAQRAADRAMRPREGGAPAFAEEFDPAALRPPGLVMQIPSGGWLVCEDWTPLGFEAIRPGSLDTLLGESSRLAFIILPSRPPLEAGHREPEIPAVPAMADGQDGFRPVATGELDLLDWSARPALDALRAPARLLLRIGGRVVGWLNVRQLSDDPASRPADVVATMLGDAALRQALARLWCVPPADSAPAREGGASVSVVICTRDRTDLLQRCLPSILALDAQGFEVIVVDNSPRTDLTEKYVRSLPGVRYVREDRPGLDNARNRGVAESRMEIVAFTDDDTVVDRRWLSAIRDAFSDPGVAAVTGLVAPMKLDTQARLYFEDVYGGMGKGFQPRRVSGKRLDSAGLLWASQYGVGANMAFRRDVFARVGPFDPDLDVGTPARGGGDIEMFHRVLAAGETLVYQPDALVWHEHRADFASLERQLEDNGTGFLAYLQASSRSRHAPRSALIRFVLVDWIGGWLLARLVRPGRNRRSLVLAEIRGLARGLQTRRPPLPPAAGLPQARSGDDRSVAPVNLTRSD